MAPQHVANIVIVETNEFVRLGLESFVAAQPGWKLAGATGELQEALSLCDSQQVDLVLLDANALARENKGPVEVVQTIKGACHSARVVFWTDGEIPELMAEILRSDADGYLSRDVTLQELLVSLQQIGRGHKLLNFPYPLATLSLCLKQPPADPGPYYAELTRREHQVLRLLSQGRTNGEIARELDIKTSTASVHVSNIIAKLKADNRTHAVLLAAELGYSELVNQRS